MPSPDPIVETPFYGETSTLVGLQNAQGATNMPVLRGAQCGTGGVDCFDG